jgi:UDP-N-acetylmuramoyl-L-alanyl-D-glutamate--2,6-diaminopimelate ligase
MLGSPHPRRLSRLVAQLLGAATIGDGDPDVTDVVYRTDDVGPGALFCAVPGSRTDGHDFAAQAEGAGAVALLVERDVEVTVPRVVVPSVREAMGPVAAKLFGHPDRELTLVGVTGTNGKTTTTYLLESIFRSAGMTPAIIGTTGVRLDGRPLPLDRTTPEAPDLHRLLRRMAGEGVGAVAMEVSSHGLEQHRVGGVRFDVGVFTNLSQDHLDYHGTLEAYLAAKARLFTPEVSERAAVNADDEAGRSLLPGGVPTLTYAIDADADLRAEDVRVTADGVAFRAGGVEIESRLRGRFSVYNCLAAMAAARQLGLPDHALAEGIAALPGVPGRIEPVEAGQDFLVLVDYAHTPDSVDNVLAAARPLATGRLVVVLGCGGDRDRGKRPLMGEAATRAADLTVVTSDNPRSEDPDAIIAEIEPGARRGGGEYVVEPDRRAAIRLALSRAEAGDVVVIAGKGHETGQEFADRTVPFDDRTVAREELEALTGGTP